MLFLLRNKKTLSDSNAWPTKYTSRELSVYLYL